MKKAHYIIFHPESGGQRQKINVQAMALVNGIFIEEWLGDIYVDRIGVGNEDPFVFNDPWLYSYCHASQLRRNERNNCYLQKGSKLFFVSGQHADTEKLTIDTVFLIGGVQSWVKKPLELPTIYKKHFEDNKSMLWRRHFRFPFYGSHKTVSHSYEADLWLKNKTDFSFLPLNKNDDRVSIPFENFSNNLLEKLKKKVVGKYPVLLTDKEMQIVSTLIDKATKTKVLKNITTTIPTTISRTIKC